MNNNKHSIDYFSIGNLPIYLNDDELYENFNLVKQGNLEARDKIFKHNLRLVIHITKRFSNTGYNLDDLFQIGSLGLFKAINTFKFELGNKFSTYAIRCIENEILMYLRKEKKRKTDISISQALYTDKDGNQLKLEDLLISADDNPIDNFLKEDEKEILKICISKLPEKKREIIKLFFGFYGRCYLQKEIADKFNFTQPYVSRIISGSLKLLRDEIKNMEMEILNLDEVNEKNGLSYSKRKKLVNKIS